MVLNADNAVWFFVGNGGMGYRGYYKGPLRDHHRDPFPDSLLSTRENGVAGLWSADLIGLRLYGSGVAENNA